jgi:hypothetical protein
LKLDQMLVLFGTSVNQIKNNVHWPLELHGQISRIVELFQ